MTKTRPWGIYNRLEKRYVEWFKYPVQAFNYIDRRLKGSKIYIVVDGRKG